MAAMTIFPPFLPSATMDADPTQFAANGDLAEEVCRRLVPAGIRYDYDVMVHVGQALLLRCRNRKDIQRELDARNNDLCLREIDYLGRRSFDHDYSTITS